MKTPSGLTHSYTRIIRAQAACLLVMILSVFSLQLVAATYTATTVAATAFDTASTLVVWENTSTAYPNDDDKRLVNIGFTFYFGNIAYTQLRIHTNGALDFGADQNFHQVYTNAALNTGSADRLIVPYWDDLADPAVNKVRYSTLGTGPNRRFVVTWQNIQRYGGTGDYLFQAVLYENNGEILFRYGAGDANGSSATIGVEVDDTDFTQYSFNSNSVSAANDILFSPSFPVINSITADCTNYNQVTIQFASPVHPIMGANPANYSINNGITVNSALVAGATVTLQTSTMNTGTNYTLQTLRPLLQSVGFTLATTTSATFRDEFNAAVFTSNNGSANWTGPWIEIGEADGANAGDVAVINDAGSNRLRIQDNDNGGEGVMREVNLSTYTSATLTYLYRRVALDDANDYVSVEISNNGGSTWIAPPLATHAGPTNDATYVAASYNITPWMSANTRIRFLSSPSMGGADIVYFDDIQIQAIAPIVCAISGPNHFAIVHDGSAVNCEAEQVTIQAHNADHSTMTTFTGGTINLSTVAARGDWAKITGLGVVNNGAANDGIASYNMLAGDNGVVVLSLKDTVVETLNINVDSGGITELTGTALASEDLGLPFAATGFRYIDAVNVPTIGTQISAKNSNVAPNAQTLYLQAIRTSDNGLSCTGVFPNGGTATIGLGSVCTNPATCLAGQRVSVTNNAITTPIANPQNLDAGQPYTNVLLTFTTNSRAQLVLNYPDAGLIQLNTRYDIPLGGGGPSGNLMTGNSNTFVVRPFGFDLDFSGDRAANGITGPSYAADANGSRFQIAGVGFPLTLRAVRWSSVDDLNNDGIPDACANLTDNVVTQNFGKETTAVVPSNVTLAHTLVAPLAGVPGILSTSANGVNFVNGIGTKTISWNEVGILTLSSTLSNYLASGQNALGNVCNVGRFYPNSFSILNPVLTNRSAIVACPDPFTYMGENFRLNYDLRALTASPPGTVTQNYIGTFAKLNPATLAQMNYGATDTATNLTARLSVASAGTFATGVAPVTSTMQMTRNTTPDGAYSAFRLGIAPLDIDSVSLLPASLNLSLSGGPNTHGLLGQTGIRYGRLNLQNNFGSELLTQTMPMTTEYYLSATDPVFVRNAADSCTTRTTANVLLYNNQAGAAKTARALGNTVINVGGGNTTLSAIPSFVAGQSTLTFSAPAVKGYVDVEVQTPSYLLSDLDGIDQGIQGPGLHCTPGLAVSNPAYIAGCAADVNLVDDIPLGRINFGIFKGSDRILYMKESY